MNETLYRLPDGKAPKYKRLADALKKLFIDEGRPHDPIPTEREIQQGFGLSRDTVRKALSTLSSQGLIYNIQGSGTYVSDRRLVRKTPTLTSFTEDMLARGSTPASTTLSCQMVTAPLAIATDLNIPTESKVLRITRLRKADGAPMAFETAYFLPESFAHVEPEVSGSLDAQLTENGYRIEQATQQISATSLNAEEARALQQPLGAASLRVHRIGYTARGLAVESTETLFRADRYDYLFTVRRNEAASATAITKEHP